MPNPNHLNLNPLENETPVDPVQPIKKP
jgi:hypothetical protein